MCQYCHCITRIEDAFIGDRIGGIEKPLYIAKLDNPIDNYLFWLVEGEAYYYKDYDGYSFSGKKFNRVMPMYYCPRCGFSLT